MMGGTIGVDSTPGIGSLFWVELPLAPASAEDVAHATQAIAATRGGAGDASETRQQAAPASIGGRRRHILLVEDVPTNRTIVVDYLHQRGYEVSAVGDGRQAIDWLLTHQLPDLILMDCQMPVMDGLEATRRIRAMKGLTMGGSHLPIIALTADVVSESRGQCFAVGMDDFLAKPFSFKDLDSTLRRWLPEGATPPDAGAGEGGVAAAVANASAPPPELAALQPQLDELDSLLARQMMNARRVAQGLVATLPEGQWQQQFEPVSRAVGYLDFPSARRALAQFIEALTAAAAATPPPPTADADLPVLDTAEALERLEGNRKLLHSAASSLPAQIVADSAAIAAALQSDDAVALAKAAHRLKGALATIGARHAAAACLALEHAGRQNEHPTFADRHQAVVASLTRLSPVLDEFLRTQGTS
jgi:CheY-like chemotaxis protein